MNPLAIGNSRSKQQLRLNWPDGREQLLGHAELRRQCPCSQCRAFRLQGMTPKVDDRVCVIEVNGHDLDELDCALDAAWKAEGKPTLILANTVKGKGVDFMENNVVYHYASGDSALCEKAKASIMRG